MKNCCRNCHHSIFQTWDRQNPCYCFSHLSGTSAKWYQKQVEILTIAPIHLWYVPLKVIQQGSSQRKSRCCLLLSYKALRSSQYCSKDLTMPQEPPWSLWERSTTTRQRIPRSPEIASDWWKSILSPMGTSEHRKSSSAKSKIENIITSRFKSCRGFQIGWINSENEHFSSFRRGGGAKGLLAPPCEDPCWATLTS